MWDVVGPKRPTAGIDCQLWNALLMAQIAGLCIRIPAEQCDQTDHSFFVQWYTAWVAYLKRLTRKMLECIAGSDEFVVCS